MPTFARMKTGMQAAVRESSAGSVRRGYPPPIKPAGPRNIFLSHLMHFCEEPKNATTPTAYREHSPYFQTNTPTEANSLCIRCFSHKAANTEACRMEHDR